jgi:predicted TIM-barrel fold metal-dependent hydrolase
VLYDVMGEVSVVELLATEYPDVDFIIPHLSSFADEWRAQVAFIDHLARHPNVYTDTAGVRRFDLLESAVERAGPHKILFGSDGPWLHPGVELAKVRLLKLPPADEKLILGENFLRLIAPVRRGAAQFTRLIPRADTVPVALAHTARAGQSVDPWLLDDR